jgi:hypothetical protein
MVPDDRIELSGEPAYRGSPRPAGARDRHVAGLVVILVAMFVGVAVLKPWGGPATPASSAGPSFLDGAPATSPARSPAIGTPTDGPSDGPTTGIDPLPVAFTTALAPGPSAWTALHWRRLALDDPLGLIVSIQRWSRGFVAIGSVEAPPASPVWTSGDGMRWDPLVFGTSTTFWPGLAILGVAERATRLVALTETIEYCGEPCAPTYELPVVSWTSTDGRSWTPHLLPQGWLAGPSGQRPLFAGGPAGLVVASPGPAARVATSADGVDWRLVSANAFPAGFVLDGLTGTTAGYVAVGRWTTSGTLGSAAALWSTDGRRWARTPTFLPTSSRVGSGVGSTEGSAAVSLLVGPEGIVALGRDPATAATIWWHSPDGRRWSALPDFPPLGPSTCGGYGCGLDPDGALVGDGQRFVALRGGPAAAAWVSGDGRSWDAVAMTGDIPTADATRATLLPAGVLLTDGSTTWWGAAIGEEP